MPASIPRPATPRLPAVPPIEVHDSPVHGLGVFASRKIRGGKTIVEYVGERIGTLEADERYDDDRMAEHHTFLFAVDDVTVIDGARGGNDARFINHSCEPNCEAFIEDGRVFIAALREIPVGTELFYDYALDREDEWQPHWEKLYACRCGAKSCRGTLLRSPPVSARAAIASKPKGGTKNAEAAKKATSVTKRKAKRAS